MKAILYREKKDDDQGTYGVFIAPCFECKTLELPWRDNASNISCIPEGRYECSVVISRKFGKVYHVRGVPDRTAILGHNGVWAGDKEKGFKTHSYGCILLGRKYGTYKKQKAIFISRLTVRDLMEHMRGESFTLEVRYVD